MDIGTEIIKSIQLMIDRALNDYKADHTYKSVIKQISPKGYVILDAAGSERTVPCCVPGVELKAGQSVWVKEPMGQLKDIHICGLAGKQ